MQMTTLCRDCLRFSESDEDTGKKHCPSCQSTRLLRHPELGTLAIAHLDCDAFFASVEKRDDPSLQDKPVIIGGGKRGVVSTACYVARLHGVRSAMPMFKALERCPDAVVIKPNMAKYSETGRAVRQMMLDVSPAVEPLSIDEAFIDLRGTERLHGHSPAVTLARLALDIEQAHGITVSIGLSHNKFLAKIASDRDKPRGFSIIGQAETDSFLANQPVSIIWGVGKKFEEKLARDGFRSLQDIRNSSESDLVRRYGKMGQRLHDLAHGRDSREVKPDRATKSVSAEITFDTDISDPATLASHLWRLSERVADRLREKGHEGKTVTLKVKTAQFKTITRSQTLPVDIRSAETLYQAAHPMLYKLADGTPYRLLGVGLDVIDQRNAASSEATAQQALFGDLELDQHDAAYRSEHEHRKLEDALHTLRSKLGKDTILKGRSLATKRPAAKDRDSQKR